MKIAIKNNKGPGRPIIVHKHKTINEGSLRLDVIPVDKPTVVKADVTSKR